MARVWCFGAKSCTSPVARMILNARRGLGESQRYSPEISSVYLQVELDRKIALGPNDLLDTRLCDLDAVGMVLQAEVDIRKQTAAQNCRCSLLECILKTVLKHIHSKSELRTIISSINVSSSASLASWTFSGSLSSSSSSSAIPLNFMKARS